MNKILWCLKYLIVPMGTGIGITLGVMAASSQPVTWGTFGTGVVMGTALIITALTFFSFRGKED